MTEYSINIHLLKMKNKIPLVHTHTICGVHTCGNILPFTHTKPDLTNCIIWLHYMQ
jgi:hypothetical protein